MKLSALERGFALRSRLLKPINEYMETVELFKVDVQDFETLQNMPDLELGRLRVLLPFLRSTVRLAMHSAGVSALGTFSARGALIHGVTSGWCHKILRPKANLLTTGDAITLCRELGDTQHQAVKQARAFQRAGALTMSDTLEDGRVRYLCPTLDTVTRMLEGCIYWNVVRMLESLAIGGPEYFKLLENPKTVDLPARKMLGACRAAYDEVYGGVNPEELTIVGDTYAGQDWPPVKVVA